MKKTTGTQETQRFYNEIGWKQQNGASVDRNLFGVREDGPIRIELNRVHQDRIRSLIAMPGSSLNLLECGCGGNPERQLLDLCRRYTGVDFSETGVQLAQSSFAGLEIDHEFKRADACELPFQDKSFDAVYSAHMLYHIEDPAAQEAALAELIRVVRAGGVVVLVSVNPRPFLFPARLLRRIAAETPVIRNLLDKLRPKPPLPYRPMPISWIRRQLALSGAVSVLGAGIPSHSFNQNVSEVSGFGAFLWKSIRWIDTRYPNRSAHLGNYFVIACRKHSHE